MIDNSNEKIEYGEKPILEVIKDESVFSIRKEGNMFLLMEECDRYYSLLLTKEEVLKMVKEITALTDKE